MEAIPNSYMLFHKDKKNTQPVLLLLLYFGIFFSFEKLLGNLGRLVFRFFINVEKALVYLFPSVGPLFGDSNLMQVWHDVATQKENPHIALMFTLILQYIGMSLLLAVPLVYTIMVPADDRWEDTFRCPSSISWRVSAYVMMLAILGLYLFSIIGFYANYIFLEIAKPWMGTINTVLASQIEESEYASAFYALLSNVSTEGTLLLNIFVGALLPAFVEEVLWRGFLQVLVQRVVKNPHVAIFLTGLTFSLWHGHFPGLVSRTLGGMLDGYLYWYTGSLFYPCLEHFTYNSYISLCQYMEQDWIGEILPPSVVSMGFIFIALWFGFTEAHKKETSLDE